jgi:hypothetical protein
VRAQQRIIIIIIRQIRWDRGCFMSPDGSGACGGDMTACARGRHCVACVRCCTVPHRRIDRHDETMHAAHDTSPRHSLGSAAQRHCGSTTSNLWQHELLGFLVSRQGLVQKGFDVCPPLARRCCCRTLCAAADDAALPLFLKPALLCMQVDVMVPCAFVVHTHPRIVVTDRYVTIAPHLLGWGTAAQAVTWWCCSSSYRGHRTTHVRVCS